MDNTLLNKIREVDPSDSDAVKEVLSSFFNTLSNYTERDCNRCLQTLENVINRFPKFCTSHRSTIEFYLVHFLDSTNIYHVISAAKCAHVLQQVKPFQDKAAPPPACWREQMNILCNAAYSLMNNIFTESGNMYEHTAVTLKTGLNIFGKSPLTRALNKLHKRRRVHNEKEILNIRLRNVFIFIQAMLVEIFPVAKPIRPQVILEVLVQVLSVSGITDKQKTDRVAMMKYEALRTLDALIACLESNLIPFSQLVFRLIMQTLRWSSENPCQEPKNVRCAAYNSLTMWLMVLNVHQPAREGRGRLWEDEVTDNIQRDIVPPKKVVQLKMSSQPMKKLSKKAKRKLANTMLQESAIASHIPGEHNKTPTSENASDDIAIAALECAETFLTVCGIFLKPATHKIFQETLVRECCSLSMYSAERSLRLLRSLEAARKAVPPTIPPPTQYCLHIYSGLVNTHQGEIQKFCSNALLDIRLHLHCSPPTLTFAMDVQSEAKNKTQTKRKIMSDRNRAVLETLLGTERVPCKDLSEDRADVISIPDEPSSKRPRHEDDIDARISLSSDSIDSVEISDDSEGEAIIVEQVGVIVESKGPNTNTEVEAGAARQNEEDSNIGETLKESMQVANESLDSQPGNKANIEIDLTKNVEDTSEDMELTVEKVNLNKLQNSESIHEMNTQIPQNVSTKAMEDDKKPLSMEVTYDYSNTSKDKITILEKTHEENLSNTNKAGDIQITCEQGVKYSLEESVKTDESSRQVGEKKDGSREVESVPLQNGMNDTLLENNVENGQVNMDTCVNISLKTVDAEKALTVDDMLADFVDEVNDVEYIES